MDLKKEIKLSDLFGRKGGGDAKPARPSKQRSKKKRAAAHTPKELVGLEVGSSQIAAAYVANNGAKKVLKLHREALPAGIMSGGEVRDPVALGAALASFFEKYDLPRKNVRLGLANTRVGVRQIQVAGVEDENQLANAIGFRANELLSIPIDEAVMDFHVIAFLAEDVEVHHGFVDRNRQKLVRPEADRVGELVLVLDPGDLDLADADSSVRKTEPDVLPRKIVLLEERRQRSTERNRVAHLAARHDAGRKGLAMKLEHLLGAVVRDVGGRDLRRADFEAHELLGRVGRGPLLLRPLLGRTSRLGVTSALASEEIGQLDFLFQIHVLRPPPVSVRARMRAFRSGSRRARSIRRASPGASSG